MSTDLVADFEKRFPTGTVIRLGLRRPADRFSVTVLFGPSGCGKTTVLRCLAGLERPEAGEIQFGPEVWFDASRGLHQPPQRRDVGFLLQEASLFPHLTVDGNISFGLRRLGRDERRQLVASLGGRLGLEGLDKRLPGQLSAGQQQRVALARAIARKPRLLLLDEPLSAIDGPSREELRLGLRGWLRSVGVPVVLVTHDVLEAVTLGDYVVVMDGGLVRQQGPLDDVFSRPADAAVARIVGVETVLRGRILEVREGVAAIGVGGVKLAAVVPPGTQGEVELFIRAQDVALVRTAPLSGSVQNQIPGRVVIVIREGALTRVILDCGFRLTALITARACDELGLSEGDRMTASIKATAIHVVARSP